MSDSQNGSPDSDTFRDEFALQVSRPEEDLDLGLAALLVAGEEYPQLDVAEHLARLDGFAEAVLSRAGGGVPAPEMARLVSSYLFEDQGFQGNANDYYIPQQLFHRVLDPMQDTTYLSCCALSPARGWRCNGGEMPHFLVGLEEREAFLTHSTAARS